MGKWRRNKSLKRRWERAQLIQKYGAICYYCGEPFAKMKDITFDHAIPTSRGGFDELANYRLAHFKCNLLKGAMTQEEFDVFQKGGEHVE